MPKKNKKSPVKRAARKRVTSKKAPKSIKARASSVKKSKGLKKKAAKPSKSPEIMLEKIGEITHYFGNVKAAAVKLTKSGIAEGDKIYIKGHTTDFKDKVKSIQLDHEPIATGKKGQEIGLSVKSRVRTGDKVYKV